ncbi:hypothetical protein VP1G_01120 [Cytospora mali]|uniref:AB hydrolase-1 domain-containing protein n=1 Tax=Cytospora mali TaxID=578113 RepID=A0A194UPS9_CYTMA|nr:hypothetical protein VP1G_01120 [Valsa mali var. pyri (nom. inval.)]
MDPFAVPALPPPIPGHTRHSRHQEVEDTNYASPSAIRPHARNESVAPASPEVISSLITSLSVISRPASAHFELPLDFLQSPSSPQPKSPNSHRGSFGVDYGAYSQPSLSELRRSEADLDETAAAPPIIKTSKPPSGYSHLTAPRSPEKREGGGLRSFLSGLSSSRPSSRGSVTSKASKDAEGPSLGNISVERGLSPVSSPEVKKPSRDSWGKKTAVRSQMGLMYMSSKERLRDNEDRRRAALGPCGGNNGGLSASAMSRTASPRLDPFLAEMSITEESSWNNENTPTKHGSATDGSMSPTPRTIPTRESSLRKTGSNAQRSSRNSRASKRNSEHGPILEEEDYFGRGDNGLQKEREGESSRNKRYSRKDICTDKFLDPSSAVTAKSSHYIDHYVTDTEAEIDDGAPAPHIAQGKRRDREASSDRGSRRRSGRSTPELRVKRSSSRLKRLSGPLSPRPEDKPKEFEPTNVTYERPQSADSIDDSVEAYLRSPRLSQKIRHPQTGRVISFSEVGDPEGSAVFCCVGMGLTRYVTAFYDELALTLKLRLITPDRPGVGDSEAYADGTATPLSWPDDVYTICQSLKITKFSILAHSAGAIYALATALRMPQHIRGRMHLLAPWIPPSQMSVFGASAQTPLPPTNAIPTSQKILRALPTPILKAANSSFMTATSSSLTSSLPRQKKTKRKPRDKDHSTSRASDRPMLDGHNSHKTSSDHPMLMVATEEMDQIRPEGASPTGTMSPTSFGASSDRYGGIGSSMGGGGNPPTDEDAMIAAAESALADKERQETYDMRLTQSIWELATTGANPAVDLLVCLERRHTIGFRYVDITRPVVLHHGSRDNRVPVENVKWLGQTMKRCEVRVLEGEGHGLMASPTVMGGVLMEISKEWEDWMRLTGASGRKEEKKSAGLK